MGFEDGGRGGDAEQAAGIAAKSVLDPIEIVKERADEGKEIFACGGELEGATSEERLAEVFFETDDLAADRGLLDAVGHVPDCLADPPVNGDVIEQFEVMDIEHSVRSRRGAARRERGRL